MCVGECIGFLDSLGSFLEDSVEGGLLVRLGAITHPGRSKITEGTAIKRRGVHHDITLHRLYHVLRTNDIITATGRNWQLGMDKLPLEHQWDKRKGPY